MSFLDAIVRRLNEKAASQKAWRDGIARARHACLAKDPTRKTVAVLAPDDVHHELERVMDLYNFSSKKQAAEMAVRVGLVLLLKLDGGQDGD